MNLGSYKSNHVCIVFISFIYISSKILLVILLKLSLQRNHHFFAKEQLIYVTSCKLLYRHWSCRKENLELMSRT
ncbi:hypothetical protein CDAR_593962, partial [Caerostris darwini]